MIKPRVVYLSFLFIFALSVLFSGIASAETDEEKYVVPCIFMDGVWTCAGTIGTHPDCISLDEQRMICEGIPADNKSKKPQYKI